MSFRRRKYPEVLDNLLTTMVGGVAAEAHPFPAAGEQQAFFLDQPPVQKIVSVYGTRNGDTVTFKAGTDYQLEADKQTLSWLNLDQPPEPGTLIHINYLREDTKPSLTDLQVGSVTRTLAESVALEIGRLYAQLQAVYDAGFIDSASGSALDKVVSLLDIKRIKGTRPTATIRLSRSKGARGNITVPAGTRVLDDQVRYEYETTETVTMAENQNTISVTARDLEPGNEPVEADTLTLLSIPIAGISQVTNPGPAQRARADETDEELRTRAKNFLHGSEKATDGALRQVLARNQLTADFDDAVPGLVTITPHGEDLSPERLEQLRKELELTRPAGVRVILAAPLTPRSLDLAIRLKTADKVVEADLRAAHAKVRKAISDYFEQLPTREDASLNQLVGRILAVDHVVDVHIDHAMAMVNNTATNLLDPAAGIIELADSPTVLGELTIADPNLPTELDLVISFPANADIPVQSQLENALSQALAYLNDLASEPVAPGDAEAQAKRTLNLGKLLLILPLPGRTPVLLSDHDNAPGPLPNPADIAPYQLQAFLSQASGLSVVLHDPSSHYQIGHGERLLLNTLVIQVEG
ncbi:MAG: baseplate J/gp47 family protein [Marinobacter sp.]|nr:baseplate J/gp47 family protein [Marinobacter sp.]